MDVCGLSLTNVRIVFRMIAVVLLLILCVPIFPLFEVGFSVPPWKFSDAMGFMRDMRVYGW